MKTFSETWRDARDRRRFAVCATLARQARRRPKDKKFTVAIIMPSLDISYWQWVAYGAKTKAQELGMNYHRA